MTTATRQIETAAQLLLKLPTCAERSIFDALIVAALDQEKRLHHLEHPEPYRDDPEEDISVA